VTEEIMRVTADREVCVGAGMCVLSAPELFDQDDDGIVSLRSSDPGPNEEAAREAAGLCPSGAVRVSD
jgi:ferredoxin